MVNEYYILSYHKVKAGFKMKEAALISGLFYKFCNSGF